MSERVNNKIEYFIFIMFFEDVGLLNGNFEFFFFILFVKVKYFLFMLLFKEINRVDLKIVLVVFFELFFYDFDKLFVLFLVRFKFSLNMMNVK